MLDIKFILANLEKVRASVKDKHAEGAHTDLDLFAKLDEQRRKAQTENDRLAAEKNKLSKQIGSIMGQRKKALGEDAAKLDEQSADLQKQSKELDNQIMQQGQAFAEAEVKLDQMRLHIPNVHDDSVPPGQDASANPVVREWGTPRNFDFKPKYHFELGEDLGILDTTRGAKVAGSGFYFLRGDGARLERAIVSFCLDEHRKNGFTEMFPPFFVSEKTALGTGHLPKFADQMYHAQEDGLFAIPTAEVPLTSLHRDEVLEEKQLPVYYCAYSACFRREAGAAGLDTRGIQRVHQFNKVEMLKLVTPEKSAEELESLTNCAEKLLQALGLRYRVITLCRGDTGFSAAKTYDIEAFSPVTGKWHEVSSCSNFTDYQARRCNLRYKPADGGKPRFVHTLNGSGLPLPRIQVTIWESFQQADGSIEIPACLRPYMGGQERIVPVKK